MEHKFTFTGANLYIKNDNNDRVTKLYTELDRTEAERCHMIDSVDNRIGILYKIVDEDTQQVVFKTKLFNYDVILEHAHRFVRAVMHDELKYSELIGKKLFPEKAQNDDYTSSDVWNTYIYIEEHPELEAEIYSAKAYLDSLTYEEVSDIYTLLMLSYNWFSSVRSEEIPVEKRYIACWAQLLNGHAFGFNNNMYHTLTNKTAFCLGTYFRESCKLCGLTWVPEDVVKEAPVYTIDSETEVPA